MSDDFANTFQTEIALFETHLKTYFGALPKEDIEGIGRLLEAMGYSLLNGGKRFRPVLTLLTAEALKVGVPAVLPLATSVELIHTYSLIHDDLPLMDNDDVRRGQPSNHKVFGDAMALLAGDALLTESLTHLAESYREQPQLAVDLVVLVGRASGLRGMVGGQAIDILPLTGAKEEWEIHYAHNAKTGALIRAAVDGVGIIAECDQPIRRSLGEFGKSLGLAFQIADDLIDYDANDLESTSFATALGPDKTRDLLNKVSDQALSALRAIKLDKSRLGSLIVYNSKRIE